MRSYDTCIAIPGVPDQRRADWGGSPVKRGLVEKPEDWPWSSFNHYSTGEEGVVEIESEWTGRKRERMGPPLRAKLVRSPLSFGENSEAEAMDEIKSLTR